MDTISFQNVIPNVFEEVDNLQSELWNQSQTFQKGHLYLVEATSGKGKSTFCSYLIGYRSDYQGQILFDQENISSFGIARWTDIRQHAVSHLFQELRLFPELTALENIEIKNNITHFQTKKQIISWFEQLGIEDKLNAKIGHMSFGQQQRVALIRSLVQPFDFLLADEPISHLDDDNAQKMQELMMNEARRQGAGVIVTSIGKHARLNYERIVKL